MIGGPSNGSSTVERSLQSPGELTKQGLSTPSEHILQRPTEGCNIAQMTINMLPEDALLEIFFHCLDNAANVDWWHTLVHICRRWRAIVFASPRRLDLQICCTEKTPVREMLNIWPTLPIIISGRGDVAEDVDNIIAALEYHDQIYRITLRGVSNLLLERSPVAPQEPFTALTSLILWSNGGLTQVVPNSFLGGSTPRLQTLWLDFIPFPGLPKLLSSTNHLVLLHLWNIPDSGYISPQVVVTCLAAMTGLESFTLGFHSPQSRANQQSRPLPPSTSILLPSLAVLKFKGVSEYLEDLLALVSVPILHSVQITFFNQLIFGTSQLTRLICHTNKLKDLNDSAEIVLYDRFIEIMTPRKPTSDGCRINLRISCTGSDWQLASLTQVWNSILPFTSLYIMDDLHHQPLWQDTEDTQWLEFLRRFTTVKELYLSEQLTFRVGTALQGLTSEKATNVLPRLQGLFLAARNWERSRPVWDAFEQFTADSCEIERKTDDGLYR